MRRASGALIPDMHAIKNERAAAAAECLGRHTGSLDKRWLMMVAIEMLKAADAAQAFSVLPIVSREEGERMRTDEAMAVDALHNASRTKIESDAKVIADKDAEVARQAAELDRIIRLDNRLLSERKAKIDELREVIKMVYRAYDTPKWLEELPRAMVKLKKLMDADEQTAGEKS